MTARFLVTGGRGFIGSTLVRKLISRGDKVLNLDLGTYAAVPGALDEVADHENYELVPGSISDPDLVRSVLHGYEPTHIVNLAAETHVDRSIDGPAPFFATNLGGVMTLLEVATDHWRRRGSEGLRLIHVSTDEVFGSISSGEASVFSPYNPSSPYAATKAGSDHLVRAWFTTYGLPTIVTNCSNNYGPFQFPEKLIPLVIVRALTGRTIPIYGDGDQVRDWIHVEDHCRGLLTVSEFGIPGSTYLIGSRTTVDNLTLVRLICQELDHLAPRPDGSSHADAIEHVQDRPGHDRRYALDPSSVEALGFAPEWELRAGLVETIRWYADNRDWWTDILEHRYGTERLGVAQ